MTPQVWKLVIIIISYIRPTVGCYQRNISCNDIKTASGYKFAHECPDRSEISVSRSQIHIAYFDPRNQNFTHLSDVRLDNESVTTKTCCDLTVECIITVREGNVEGKCLDFFVTEEIKNPEVVHTPWSLIFGVLFGVIILVGIATVILICYFRWKKELKKQRRGAATVPSFFRYLLTGSCLRKTVPAESEENGETRFPAGREVQEVASGDEETQQNGDIRNGNSSVRNPRGSGENETEENNTLGSEPVHSIDSKSDGNTPQSLSLDRNLSNGRIVPTKNGDITAPGVDSTSSHQDMNRTMRDDPGGVIIHEIKDPLREMENGWAAAGHDAEDYGTEGRPLLLNQRAAIQTSDMTGEAIALLNKPGFDPDQHGRCRAAQETDVESTHNMRNK